MKRFITVLMSAMIALSMMPTMAFAANNNEQVNVSSFEDLKTALTAAAASGSGDTVINITGDINATDQQWTPIHIDGYQGAGVITIKGNNNKITGLNDMLFSGGFAGKCGLVIEDLTIESASIKKNIPNQTGVGAIIGMVDSMPTVTLKNCHLINSEVNVVGDAWVGGLIGYTSGYDNPNDGPVDTHIDVEDCSVENCNITTTSGSVGGIFGHSGGNAATYQTVSNCKVIKTTLNTGETGEWRVGTVAGTVGVGQLSIEGINESNNTLTQTGREAPDHSNLYGRFKNSTGSGVLQIDGAIVEGSADVAAKVGDKFYDTLEEAFQEVNSGETIKLQDNCHGNGVIVKGDSKRTFTVDFNGFTYTVDGSNLAGSSGTKSQCFQLLKGSTITMKNGTIVADNNVCSMIIQNYSNLTLENMTLDATQGTNNVSYVLSNNCGNINIVGSTSIIAKPGKPAFDVYYWPSNGYSEGVNVTVDTTGSINGRIEYGSDNSSNAADEMHDKCKLEIKNGTFDGTIDPNYCNDNPNIVISGGSFKVDPSAYVAKGYIATENDGMWVVGETPKVAAIGSVQYETLAEAVEAVKDGETIEVLSDCSGDGIKAEGKSNRTFTIDFNNHTFTMDGSTVGSSGTETLCFQLLKGSTITMKDGTLVADTSGSYMMVQNYCNLTLENMTLDATKGNNNVDYVLSNNCGNIDIKGNTSIIAKEGKHAFDVYYWPNNGYSEGVNVTVDTTGIIKGIVEYGSDNTGNAAADMHDKCKLEIKNGTFEGTIDPYYCNDNPNIVISGGSFKVDPSAYVADGYVATKSGDVWTVAAPVAPTPTPEPEDPITNTGSGDNASTNVDASDNTTTSDSGKTETTIDSTLGDKIVENAKDNNVADVVIKAETEKGDSTGSTVALPESTVQALAKDTEASVTIKTDSAEVSLDKAAVDAVAAQAGTDGEVKLVVETKEQNKNKVEIELKLVTSKGTVSDFQGGNVTVTVPVNEELAGKKLVCVYIDENGKYTKMEGSLSADDKSYTFTTGHFSTYAILSEEEADAVIAEQNKPEAKPVKVGNSTVKVYAYKGGKLRVKASAKNATGYKVFYKKSSWKNYKTYTRGKIDTLDKTFKKLSKGKYTVQVRAYYKDYDGTKAVTWGAKSKAKTITVKK